jgi:hypothetical protein
MSSPMISIVPSEIGSIDVIIRIRVVFSAPFAPRKPSSEPFRIPSDTQFTAGIGSLVVLENNLEQFTIRTA